MNVNGYPSNKANRHKLRDLNRLMRGIDVLLAVETGINKNNKPKMITDDHNVTRINH